MANEGIKGGEVAVVKMTGEPVFVLGLTAADPVWQGFSGVVVTARRAVEGRDGLRYEQAQFFIEELENLDSRRKKQYAEFMEMAGQANVLPEDVTAESVN